MTSERMPVLLGIFAGICGCALAAPAAAQTTFNVAIMQSGTANATEYQLTPGDHDVSMDSSEWVAPVISDPTSPLRGLHGTCFGMTEFKGDEVVGGGGYCTYQNADGDRYVSRWTPRDNARGTGSSGEWTAVSGTGVFEGVTGSGVYRIGRVAGKLRTRQLTGALTFPDLSKEPETN